MGQLHYTCAATLVMYRPIKKTVTPEYLLIYSHGHHDDITDGNKFKKNICMGHLMRTYTRSVTKIHQLIQKLHGRKQTCRRGGMTSLCRMNQNTCTALHCVILL